MWKRVCDGDPLQKFTDPCSRSSSGYKGKGNGLDQSSKSQRSSRLPWRGFSRGVIFNSECTVDSFGELFNMHLPGPSSGPVTSESVRVHSALCYI